jgi:hypothetical protein
MAQKLMARRLNSLAVDGLMEQLNRSTVDSLMVNSSRLDGLTLQWLHASMAQKLMARWLNIWQLDGSPARWLGDSWLDSSTALLPVDDTTAHQLGGSTVWWLDGLSARLPNSLTADGLVVQRSTAWWLPSLAAWLFHGSMVGGTTAQRLDGSTVGDWRLTG